MKIKVEGVEYEVPQIDTLTWDESILLERHAGVTLNELTVGEGIPMGASKALVIIAIMRAQPNISEREISAMIGAIKLSEMDEIVVGEDEAGPPEPTRSEPGPSSETSGDASSNGSEHPDTATPSSSGIPDLPTGPTSDRETLVG